MGSPCSLFLKVVQQQLQTKIMAGNFEGGRASLIGSFAAVRREEEERIRRQENLLTSHLELRLFTRRLRTAIADTDGAQIAQWRTILWNALRQVNQTELSFGRNFAIHFNARQRLYMQETIQAALNAKENADALLELTN